MGVDALTLPHMAHGAATVKVDKANLRAAPDLEAAIAAQWAHGTLATVWAKDGNWCLVQSAAGETGWMHVSVLDVGALVP